MKASKAILLMRATEFIGTQNNTEKDEAWETDFEGAERVLVKFLEYEKVPLWRLESCFETDNRKWSHSEQFVLESSARERATEDLKRYMKDYFSCTGLKTITLTTPTGEKHVLFPVQDTEAELGV